MRKLFLTVLLLLLASSAESQTLTPVTVDLNWAHDGKNVTGFRIHKGSSVSSLSKAVDINGASVRTYRYTGNEALPVCIGISAVNQLGESPVVSKTDAGVDVCLGKPGAPTSFTFSVQ